MGGLLSGLGQKAENMNFGNWFGGGGMSGTGASPVSERYGSWNNLEFGSGGYE
jgi:hypothetical protein